MKKSTSHIASGNPNVNHKLHMSANQKLPESAINQEDVSELAQAGETIEGILPEGDLKKFLGCGG